jgi:hypothetical protein
MQRKYQNCAMSAFSLSHPSHLMFIIC